MLLGVLMNHRRVGGNVGQRAFARGERLGVRGHSHDVAVPRDIDPAVNDLENVYLFDIDGNRSQSSGLDHLQELLQHRTVTSHDDHFTHDRITMANVGRFDVSNLGFCRREWQPPGDLLLDQGVHGLG